MSNKVSHHSSLLVQQTRELSLTEGRGRHRGAQSRDAATRHTRLQALSAKPHGITVWAPGTSLLFPKLAVLDTNTDRRGLMGTSLPLAYAGLLLGINLPKYKASL